MVTYSKVVGCFSVLCLCLLLAEQLRAQLMEIHALLVRVGNMSALVALIKAASVRDDFQRTNRDLINTFNILAQGEQLLVSEDVGDSA
jgi:hypothetical protein